VEVAQHRRAVALRRRRGGKAGVVVGGKPAPARRQQAAGRRRWVFRDALGAAAMGATIRLAAAWLEFVRND